MSPPDSDLESAIASLTTTQQETSVSTHYDTDTVPQQTEQEGAAVATTTARNVTTTGTDTVSSSSSSSSPSLESADFCPPDDIESQNKQQESKQETKTEIVTTTTTTTTTATNNITPNTLKQRFLIECRTKPCDLQSQFSTTDSLTGNEIDIQKSFAPTGWKVLLWKFTILAITIHAIIACRSPFPFWFVYITSWGIIFTTLYFAVSFINSLLATIAQASKNNASLPNNAYNSTNDNTLNLRTKATWMIYVLAINITVFALWGWCNPPPILDYYIFAAHGITITLLIIDGFIVNAIPFHVMHWASLVVPYMTLWLIFSLIHAYGTDIGNPELSDNDPDTTDDYIYNLVDWKNNLVGTILIGLAAFFCTTPFASMVLWAIFHKFVTPRYYNKNSHSSIEGDDNTASNNDKNNKNKNNNKNDNDDNNKKKNSNMLNKQSSHKNSEHNALDETDVTDHTSSPFAYSFTDLMEPHEEVKVKEEKEAPLSKGAVTFKDEAKEEDEEQTITFEREDDDDDKDREGKEEEEEAAVVYA